MTSISLCIICYDEDYMLIYNLLNNFTFQTDVVDEIIVVCSGLVDISIPEYLYIKDKQISIKKCVVSQRIMQSKARNIGSSIANCDYIIFFDVDDQPHKQKIELTKKIIKDTSCDFLLHDYCSYPEILNQQIAEDTIETYPITEINQTCTNIKCFDYPIHHSHIAIKKSVFEKLKFNESEQFYRTEDGKFCQDLVINGYKGIYTPLKLVYYTA